MTLYFLQTLTLRLNFKTWTRPKKLKHELIVINTYISRHKNLKYIHQQKKLKIHNYFIGWDSQAYKPLLSKNTLNYI
jgi:hypothetical protein